MKNSVITLGLLTTITSLYLFNFPITTGELTTTNCVPQQVRLQLGDSYQYSQDQNDNSDVAITFQTKDECKDSYVTITQNWQTSKFTTHEIVHSKYDKVEFCHSSLCEKVWYDQYVHHFKVKLNQLSSFSYTVNGGDSFLASQKSFTAKVPAKSVTANQVQKFIYFGDLDNSDMSKATWKLLESLKDQQTDAYIFLGDYGYEFFQSNGTQGDKFLNTLEPYATQIPWLMTPGNHEDNLNYTFYNDKIHHPNFKKSQNHYYSVNIGLVHFISVDLYFYDDSTNSQDKQAKKQMIAWLEQDLIQANKNRAQVPWIIATGHVSVYCVASDCNDYPTMYKKFDDLFYKYGLDVFIGAHKHKYQFLKPIYQDKIYGFDRPNDHTIVNPKAPIYVIQGNGGNRNMEAELGSKHSEYLLSEDAVPGQGRLTVYNSTDLLFEYIRSDDQKVFDYQHLTKKSHNLP